MKIKPHKDKVYIKVPDAKAGVLDTSSRAAAVEYAEVVAVGEGVTGIKKGDHLFVKAWAVDIINHEEKEYRFVDINSLGIVAIVE